MNSLINQIAEANNLYWAWEKAQAFYKPGDIWFNELEVASFEANLHYEIEQLSKDLIQGSFKLLPIKPVGFPKGNDDMGETRARQTFWISVRDQVAWLAVVNVIGKYYDLKMPYWSYGNRLHISTFYEINTDGKRELKFGYYRNTGKNTYRKWIQSWPLYRKHINLTAKFLAYSQPELDESDLGLIEINENLANSHPLKIKYLNQEYWKSESSEKLFWAGLDLGKFYQSVRNEVIYENLKKFIDIAHWSEALSLLLKELLEFKIDFSDWDSSENENLNLIGLGERKTDFNHIPTGLFSAGFLANVALLNVDKIVGSKLEDDRTIAHFRYVDDHVILSKSFENLVKWIEQCEELLRTEDIGPSFNPTKTQPPQLADYFKERNEDSTSPKCALAKIEAEKHTLLDPEFPSPLMTQTLAKVSRIASTDFQLLDPEGEKSLVADIEHLLVTEFPDQELRRDTRISFAAKMLTSVVPLLTSDPSEVYETWKKLTFAKEEYSKVRENSDSEKTKSLINQISLLEEQLKKCRNGILSVENAIYQKTIKLLLKSVRENHEKVRLWTRLYEFYFKSGSENTSLITTEIHGLIENKNAHQLSVVFIKSLILQVISRLLIESIEICLSVNFPIKRKHRTLKFIGEILNNNNLEYFLNQKSDKNYYKVSMDLFKFTSGTLLFLLREEIMLKEIVDAEQIITKYGLINWRENPKNFTNSTNYSFGIWAWWILNTTTKNSIVENNEFVEIVLSNLDLKDKPDRSVLQLFPTRFPSNLIAKIKDLPNYAEFSEGWLIELKKGLIARNLPSRQKLLRPFNGGSKRYKMNITVVAFVDWLNRDQKSIDQIHQDSFSFDPRTGEWMALEIIKQISLAVQEKINPDIMDFGRENKYFKYINPQNFILPVSWIDEPLNSWEDLQKKIGTKRRVKFKRENNLIVDHRYTGAIAMQENSAINDSLENEAIINSLGIILIGLLSKNFDLPFKWNVIGQQAARLNLAKTKMQNSTISSLTRGAISGCFSKRNKETNRFKSNPDSIREFFDDDTCYDPPNFIDVQSFITYITNCQHQLEKHQLSVAMNQPRQLTPVSLTQLTSPDFQKFLTEEI